MHYASQLLAIRRNRESGFLLFPEGFSQTCQKSVQNIERCLVGGIFMCFESDNCRRTYLSQRDLQAHIDHRHRVGSTGGSTTTPAAPGAVQVKTSTAQKTQSKVSPDDSGNQPIPTGSTVPVSLSNDSLSLLQSLQRSSNLAQCASVSVSSATLGFTTGNKNVGLLPLPPTSTSTSLPHPRIPMNVAPPVRPPPTLTPFPQMMQFSTPPPPLGPRGIPPPSVMNPSIPPPAVPAPRSQPPPFSSTNAVAALAAAAAAMSGTHPKPPAMQGRSNSLLSAPLSVGSTGHLQSCLTSEKADVSRGYELKRQQSTSWFLVTILDHRLHELPVDSA
ncbi:hypothetical protein X801_03153 [Opisthorchis viverrini]|uniref:Hakai C2H2 zinc finger domain-containing protein n=1 Tax=Opisthorchis viverrini TaxID=6198 RepID=A0A1S8X2Q4_OPIVI|nr:hypothetical protein X801_03153 [Opisthorchis viverrini]